MHTDNRCDKHLSPREATTGNKEEPGEETRAEELRSRRLLCQEFLSLLEEDDPGGRGEPCSVPTAEKNDVHVIVSCLLQELMGCLMREWCLGKHKVKTGGVSSAGQYNH